MRFKSLQTRIRKPLICLVVWMLAAVAAAADGPAMVAVGRGDAPRIDGRLDDRCWQSAAVLAPFLLNDGSGPASQQTVVRACWDDRALYLAFRCFERALAPATQQRHLLRGDVREHDANLFADECVEIFLRPGGRGDYFQLAANLRGTRYDSRGTDATANPEWEAATAADETEWTLEAAIPFASLGASVPKPGERWSANFCRTEHPLQEHSTWCGLQGAYHAPESFGEILFAGRAAPVQLADLTDLAASAPALRLCLGAGSPALQGEIQVKGAAVRQSRAGAPQGASELRIAYPAVRDAAGGSVRYQVALADGTPAYRSPWFPQAGAVLTLTGALTLDGGEGRLLHNGREAAVLPAGKPVSILLRLEPGENVIGLVTSGGCRVSGGLTCGAQPVPFDAGWRWADRPAEGWDRPGAGLDGWKPVTAPARGPLVLPAGAKLCLRRVIAVPTRRERFWPLQTDVNLPRGGGMFLKPILGWVGDPPAGYTYCLDLPSPMRVIACDNLDGVPVKLVRGERLRRDGRDYTRYRLEPVGTLTGGMTLELVWSNKGKTNHEYMPAFSLGGDFDWRDFAIEVTSPAYAEQLRVLCLKWQNRGIYGTCWFDDIQVTEKGTAVNLLPPGDFEGEAWKGKPNVAEYARDGKPNRACRLTGTQEQVGGQAGLWVTGDPLEVKPGTRYIVRLRARGEKIVSQGGAGRACLLLDVGSPKESRLTLYSHYEGLGGHVVEAEQATTVTLLPALKRRAPKQVPIIACYDGAAYENPRVVAATAEMVLGAGINWLWGSNQSEIARRVRPHGVKFVWAIPRDGYSQEPIDRDYLKRHPEHAALQRNGARSTREICPTVLLDTPNEFVPKLSAWLTERTRENPYDMIDWDHEFPTDRAHSVCLCERCRKAFAGAAGLASVPSPQEVFDRYGKEWVAFRCGQNVRMARILRDAVRAANPAIPFTVYSGYQNDTTQSTYGVDWAKMRDAIDWGIAGYNGGRGTVQGAMKALGKVPFTTGCMYVEQRFRAEYPYPTPQSWRTRLMRAVLDDEGTGFLVWYLPVLDGGGYWGIGWVSALVADFEAFFTHFERRDDLVKAEPALDTDTLAVLVCGKERLAIAMNPGSDTRSVTLRVQEPPPGSRLVEYETGREFDPARPLAVSLPPGEIKVYHLRAK